MGSRIDLLEVEEGGVGGLVGKGCMSCCRGMRFERCWVGDGDLEVVGGIWSSSVFWKIWV